MFLTPFIDFGEPVEKIFGLPPMEKVDDEDEVKPESVVVTAKEQVHAGRVRIIGVTDRVRIVSSSERGTKIEGSGLAIGPGPLDQSKAYFEIVVEQDGTKLGIGAIGRNPTQVLSENWQLLSKVPNSVSSGMLGTFNAGDVVGVLVDISDFPPSVSAFKNNDQLVKQSSASVRGDVWPVIEILSGSVTVVFNPDQLRYLTPQRISRGIEAVMLSRSII
jgi:hypothetical protein